MAKQKPSRYIKIVQVYPFNNPVTKIKTKSVVMAGIPYVLFSKYFDNIIIISRATNDPYNEKVVGILAKNKKEYYKKIIEYLSSIDPIPKVIEVHQDVSLATFIIKKFSNKVKVSVIRHGPALYRSFHDKIFFIKYFYEKFILSKLTYVYCISNYVTNSFKRNYPNYEQKFITIYNTYGHLKLDDITLDKVTNSGFINNFSKKDNVILFVGKPLRFKGIFIFLKGVTTFLKSKSNWSAMIIGAKFSKKSKYGKTISKLNKGVAFGYIKKISLFEGLPIEKVFNKMKQSKVVVVPCIVTEPFCLVALEAHIAGCLVVSSGRGALKEVSGEYAYYLNKLSANNLLKVLLHIDSNPKEAEEKALLGYKYALQKFNPQELVKKLDIIREKLINEIDE